jgi:hypothetical protein
VNRWSVALYAPDDLTAPVAEPTLVTLPTFKAEFDELGDGGVTVQLSDTEAALVDVDQILVFTLDGTDVHAVVVEEIDYVTKASSRGQRVLTIRGRGVLALLEQAIVEPATGTGHLPLEEVRQFNWTAFDFDDSGPEWVAATEYATVTEATTFWTGLPPTSPTTASPTARASRSTSAPQPVTRTTPRKVTATTASTITAAAPILFDLFMAADNYAEAYLDGVLILTSPGFGITRHIEGGIQITTGDHVLAFKVTNFFDDGSPGGNPSMLIYTACSLTVDGLIGEVLTFSGSLTLINEYPAAAPGLPICAALKTFVDEAQAATPPRLVGVTYDFDELNDSNVAAMDPISDLAARVGDDGVTFSRQLIDSGYGHIRMTPGLVLQVYKPGTLGEVTEARPKYLTIGHRKRAAPATSALVKWRDTYTEYESTVEPAKRRFLRLDQAPSAESGAAIGQAVVDARSSPLTAVSATIDAGLGPNADEPFTGFFVGDSLPILMHDDTISDEVVQDITFTCNDAGHPRWNVGILDRILDAEQRVQRLQKRMLSGALAGLSNTPSLLTALGTSKGTQYRLKYDKFSYTGDDLDSARFKVSQTADIFWMEVMLDEIWPDDVTAVLRVNVLDTPHTLECTVPAGDEHNKVWLAVGTTKVTTGDWFMLGITEPAAPPRLSVTLAFRG